MHRSESSCSGAIKKVFLSTYPYLLVYALQIVIFRNAMVGLLMKSSYCTNKTVWFIITILVFSLVPSVATAVPVSHPALLFHDISETPGYQNNAIQPWKNYQQQIIQSGKVALTKDFTKNLGAYDRVNYRSGFARDAAFAYQVTKDPKYADKAKEGLMNLDVGKVTIRTDNALALGGYALAYDLVQPSLDPASDQAIRDKLATLADKVYKSLNEDGKNPQYISFADFHGQAYPMVGIAAAALSDYTNPNHLPLSSSPDDWLKVGTDYLFVDDKLHSYDRSLFSFGFDDVSGKHLNGAYKSYVIDDYAWWLQVYNHFYQANPFDKYPVAKNAFTSELWESLPNGYGNNYVTNGNLKWTYHRAFVNLLNDTEKSEVLTFDDKLINSDLLPFSSSIGGGTPPELLYCTYGNYAYLPKTDPPGTSHLDPQAVYQVFRNGPEPDSDWMSVVTWNYTSNSNRDMAHMDQAGIEYYSRGDLLLADAGENKYALDHIYGEYEIHHNTVAIEDPRTPFSPGTWSGSAARGIYKGDSHGLVTPAEVPAVVQSPWIEGIDIHATIDHVVGKNFGDSQKLSSPIEYTRTILYPKSGYFIIADRFMGSEPWIYRTIFRPTSLMTTPSVRQANHLVLPEDVGHVNGKLSLGSTDYDWLSLSYKNDTDTGIRTGSVVWNTQNPYGKDVELNVFSVPVSEVYLNKVVGRIGGYDGRSEVFSPVLSLRDPASDDLYRVTVLLSRYPEEEARNVEEIAVKGNGHAVKVHLSGSDDFIYAGSGVSTFDRFTTDAAVVMVRQTGSNKEVTLIGGSYVNDGNEPMVALSQYADYFTVNKTGQSTDYRTSGDRSTNMNLFGNNPGVVTPAPGEMPARKAKSGSSGLPGSGKTGSPGDTVNPLGGDNTGAVGSLLGWVHMVFPWLFPNNT
jgi:hypothetical protein